MPDMSEPDGRVGTVDAVADELNWLRRRGLRWVDGHSSGQHPLALPQLERLANRYLGASAPRARSPLIRQYLEAALREFEERGNADDADLIRSLFFDPKGLPLGTRSPGKLLDEARKKTGLSEDEFRKLRHQLFRDFAEFLIDLQPLQHPPSGLNEAC